MTRTGHRLKEIEVADLFATDVLPGGAAVAFAYAYFEHRYWALQVMSSLLFIESVTSRRTP